MELQYFFINNRFFILANRLEYRLIENFLKYCTVWQDRTIMYKGKTWAGYEVLPDTKQHIEALLQRIYNAVDITEEYTSYQRIH